MTLQSVPQRIAFSTVLAVTMGAATFALVIFGVLAAEIRAEFGVARWQIGVLVTGTSLGGAVVSPWLGRVADRIGARRSTIGTLIIASGALLAVAGAPTYLFLVVAALLTGMAQAASNPATNKLISVHVPHGRRGVITGIKQSGVQFGVFLGGLLLPVFAVWWGWRGAVVAFTLAPIAAVVLSLLTVPPDPPEEAGTDGDGGDRLDPFIVKLAVYGFLLGAGGTTIFTYLPLYGQEALGLSQAAAGTAVGLMGLTGVVARITWSRVAELSIGSVRALKAIALLAAAAALVLLVAPRVGAWMLWPAALVTGVSASAWNSVGMLAIIQTLPARLAGRGSGVVLLGFLAGLGLGAPAFGWSVDLLGTYGPGWVVVTLIFTAAWVTMRQVRAPEVRTT